MLADLAVFVFFGLMATAGTAAVQGAGVPARAWWAAVAIGLLAVAVLVANNLRDLATDRDAGRHTLVVRLGDGPARRLYEALHRGRRARAHRRGAARASFPCWPWSRCWPSPPWCSPLRVAGSRHLQGRGLVPLLPLTARLHLALGVLLAAALLAAALLPHAVGMAHLW